jgi:hypothetical protein
MVEAAKIVEQARPDVIDLNFGCPVKKVAGKGAGAGNEGVDTTLVHVESDSLILS